MRAETERTTPKVIAPVDQQALATLQDFMASHNYVLASNVINQARVSINRITANPAVTSGLSPRDYGINFANTNPAGARPAVDRRLRLLRRRRGRPRRRAAAVRVARQPRVAGGRRHHLDHGRHSLKFGVDIRREAMNIAFINRPNGDLTFSGGITGNAAADFLLGLPAQARATTTQAIQDGYGWLFAGYVQDDFRVTLAADRQPRPALRAADAVHRRQRRDHRRSTPGSSRPSSRTPRPGWSMPATPGVPRGIVPTDKNNFAPRLSVAWDPFGDGRTSVRSAFGMFYDALAGQGDFFQSGVLSPPFTPLVELNTPTPITLSDPLAAVAGPPNPFPPALTVIGWGDDFKSPFAYHFNVGVQRQLARNLGAEVSYVGSRGYNLPIFMEVNPGVYAPGQTARGARLMPAYALVRPTFPVGKSWFDSLQASLRLLPTRGLNLLASYTLGKATDHLSGLNIGGEPRPVLPVVQGDEASIDQALDGREGAGALRRPAPLRAQLRLRAAAARRPARRRCGRLPAAGS